MTSAQKQKTDSVTFFSIDQLSTNVSIGGHLGIAFNLWTF
jgi:hypothetical protein